MDKRGEHLLAPSYFGSVGTGWDAFEKYIETKAIHHALFFFLDYKSFINFNRIIYERRKS